MRDNIFLTNDSLYGNYTIITDKDGTKFHISNCVEYSDIIFILKI